MNVQFVVDELEDDDGDLELLFGDSIPHTGEAGTRYTATVYEERTIAKVNMGTVADYVEKDDAEGEVHVTTEFAEARA